METKTYGYDRKAKVPALAGTKPKGCPRCQRWFAAPLRARVCDGCQKPSVLAKRAELQKLAVNKSGKNTPHSGTGGKVNGQNAQVTEGSNEPSDADKFQDLSIWWAGRTSKLMAWLEATGLPARDYPRYGDLTAREVSVGIGWIPWPAVWPKRKVTPRQLKTLLDATPSLLLAKRKTTGKV